MKIVGIIPARYGSTRFPGKPLARLQGHPMLFHVFEHASSSRLLTEVVVATESSVIGDACKLQGIPYLLTSPTHENPTLRICEAAGRIPADLYVMIGGDEPLLTGEDIDHVIQKALTLYKTHTDEKRLLVVNAMAPVQSPAEAMDATNIKIVCNKENQGLYASRSPIPYPKGELAFTYKKFASIGVYTQKALDFFYHTPKGMLEDIEECDLLRFMEHQVPVFFVDTAHFSLSVDTQKDLRQVEHMMEACGTSDSTGNLSVPPSTSH